MRSFPFHKENMNLKKKKAAGLLVCWNAEHAGV